MKKRKRIYVKWVDHASESGWRNNAESAGSVGIETVAFFLKETKNDVIVTHSIADDDGPYAPFAIYKKAILKRKWLR